MSISLTLSTFYLSLLALIWLKLTFSVVKLRLSEGVGFGDGGVSALQKNIRCHANFCEVLLPFSLVFILAEYSGLEALYLHIAGISFVLGRLLHAYGLGRSKGTSVGRFSGSTLSWTPMLALAIYNLIQSAPNILS